MSTNHWIPVKSPVLHDARLGRLSNAAHRLFITSLFICGYEKTEGRFPRSSSTPEDIAWQVRMEPESATQAIDELVENGRWAKDADGRWAIPDFTDFVYLRDAPSDPAASGSQGGHARWHDSKHVAEGRFEPQCPKCQQAPPQGPTPHVVDEGDLESTNGSPIGEAIDALVWDVPTTQAPQAA